MLSFCLFLALGQITPDLMDIDQLGKLAKEVVREKEVVTFPPNFTVDGNTIVLNQTAKVICDDALPSKNYSTLKELIRLDVIEANKPAFFSKAQHDGIVTKVREKIYDYFKGRIKVADNETLESLTNEVYITAVKATVEGMDKKFFTAAGEVIYKVDLVSIPKDAKIYLMSVLRYKLIELEKGNPVVEIKKCIVTQTKDVPLNGYYYYFLEWDDGKTSGPVKTKITTSGKVELK